MDEIDPEECQNDISESKKEQSICNFEAKIAENKPSTGPSKPPRKARPQGKLVSAMINAFSNRELKD